MTAMKLEHCIFTDKGGREVNEDCAAAVSSGGRYCFILCDGLGGHGMGGRASSLVTKALSDCFKASGSIGEFAKAALEKANDELLKAQRSDARQREMRATAVVLCIDGDRGTVLHIGDSRLYRFRKGRVISRTTDHSLPQMLCLAGEISEEEIRSHPDRSRLLRALGDDAEELRYERTDFEVQAGDAFLLCSDGLWEPVTEAEMERLLADTGKAKKWLARLAGLARANSSGRVMDNYTAVAVTVKE